jgi:hypothetical protein
MIGLARLSHEVLEPKWPVIQTSLLQGYEIASTIFKKRVWSPFRDIVVNLISRKNTLLLEFFDVTNEVTSLDNMLRDLGFGDGTEATRQEALILASRRYELDLKHGLTGSAVPGTSAPPVVGPSPAIKGWIVACLGWYRCARGGESSQRTTVAAHPQS